jgi:hypothetical protein
MNIYIYSYVSEMPAPEYVYGTVDIFTRYTTWMYRLFGWTNKEVILMFDRNPYSQPVASLGTVPSITFSNYQWNRVLPFTIYRKPEGSEHQEYYNIIHDTSIVEKIKTMVKNYPNQANIDWSMIDTSEYNCVYSDILDADKMHLAIIRLKYREAYLVVYNSREFTESQVGTIIRRIFINGQNA